MDIYCTYKRRKFYLLTLLLIYVLIYARWSDSLRRGTFIKAGIFILVNIYPCSPTAAVHMTG